MRKPVSAVLQRQPPKKRTGMLKSFSQDQLRAPVRCTSQAAYSLSENEADA